MPTEQSPNERADARARRLSTLSAADGPLSPSSAAATVNNPASLQRWLDWLHAAHLIRYHGDLDEHGYWWRTTVELLPPPPVDVEDLARARERMKGWPARDTRRPG